MCILAGRDMLPPSTAKPLSSQATLKPSAQPDSQLLIKAGVQETEKLASTKLMPVAPAEINDSRPRLLFEHHSWEKDGVACLNKLGLEEQLKAQEASRTIVRSPRQSCSQGCSPTPELESKVICVSFPYIFKVVSICPLLQLTSALETHMDLRAEV